jgi:hypothetical protein
MFPVLPDPMLQVAQEYSRHDAILNGILDPEIHRFGGLGLFAEVVVPKSEPIGAVVTLLVVVADHQWPVFLAELLEDSVDGATLEVGENHGQIIQLPVFLGDGAGKRVNLGWIRAGAGLCVANCCSRGVGLVQSTKNRG